MYWTKTCEITIKCKFHFYITLEIITVLEFQHFLPQQIKCQVTIRTYILPQLFLSRFLSKSKLLKLLPFLHISPQIRSIMCTIIVVQILLYKYCYMQCNVLFSHIKNCVLKIISDALFEFKSKDKYERKMLNRLKRNFKRKIYINSFINSLMSQVLFFFGTSRWTNGKRMKQKSYLKLWHHRILPIQWYMMWKEGLFHCHINKEKGDE